MRVAFSRQTNIAIEIINENRKLIVLHLTEDATGTRKQEEYIKFYGKVVEPVFYDYYPEMEWIMNTRLFHLNMLIFKDVLLKLRLAEKLQEKYKGTLAYELGILTAGILETFRDMLDVYYYFSKSVTHHNRTYDIDQITNGYNFIHGAYMEILNDKDMYYNVLNNYLDNKRAEEQRKYESMKRKFKLDQVAKQKKRLQQKGAPAAAAAKVRRRNVDPPSDTEYKRQLRLKKWAQKWNNFDPKVEGIDVNVKVDVEAIRKALNQKKNKPFK